MSEDDPMRRFQAATDERAALARMSEPENAANAKAASQEAQRVAEYLLTHIGGDESQPWQAGHNYAMREAARLIREQYHLLDYGVTMPCCDCGQAGPHKILTGGTRVECGTDEQTCGGSWGIDQRGIFTDEDYD